MKISNFVVYKVKPRWIFIKIMTDEGISGWGELVSVLRPRQLSLVSKRWQVN